MRAHKERGIWYNSAVMTEAQFKFYPFKFLTKEGAGQIRRVAPL